MTLARYLPAPARVLVLALLACSQNAGCKSTPPTDETSDGGAPPRAVVGATRDASLPATELPRCSDARCDDPVDPGPLGEQACCLPSGGCGLTARTLSLPCLAPRGPGTVDLACPTHRLVDGTVVQGCCAPSGQCGLYDRFGELGCFPDSDSDSDASAETGVACVYVPDASCRRVIEVTCRGQEDCEKGQSCCARTAHDGFDAYGCFASCNVQSEATSELWLEICRNDASCSDPGSVCSSEQGLPPTIGRCRLRAPLLAEGGASVDAGAPPQTGPLCGMNDCGTGEKCCLRDPAEPYCAPSGTRCQCAPGAKD